MKTITNEFSISFPYRVYRLYDDGSTTVTTRVLTENAGIIENTCPITFDTYASAMVKNHKEEITRAAYGKYFDRQRAKERKQPAINYDAIVAAAESVLWAQYNVFQQRVKNGYKSGAVCQLWLPSNKNVRDAYDGLDAETRALNAVCDATGVSVDAAMRAARAMDKWYRKTYMEHRPDAEKLLRAMA